MAELTSPAPSKFSSPHGAASVHLDALRGIAAVGVFLNHLRDLLFKDYPQLPHHNVLIAAIYFVTGLGPEWVIIFFVLSGYLVGGSVLRSISTARWSWGPYLLARLTRLYTVLIPALVLGGLIDLAGMHIFGTAGLYGGHAENHTITASVATRLGIPILLGNYAFLQGIYVPVFGSNGPLWSLANEFWYYIAFPFLACACWSRLSPAKRAVNFLFFIGVLFFVHPAIALMGLIWLMGVAIHYLPPLPAGMSPMVRRALVTAALLLTVAVLYWTKRTHTSAANYVLGVAITALIYAILNGARRLPSVAYRWSSHALSRSSYTLYLVHLPLVVFLCAWLVPVRVFPAPRPILVGVAIFAVVFCYAQLVWFLFEKRTDSLRAWMKSRISRSGSLPREVSADPAPEITTQAQNSLG